MNTSEKVPYSRKRRLMLGWGGVGISGLIAGGLGWWVASRKAVDEGLALPKTAAVPSPNYTHEETPVEPVSPPPPVSLAREVFAENLGTEFNVNLDGLDRPFKLVDVSPTQAFDGKGVHYTSFAVLFESHAAYLFESRVYRITHPKMGVMDLFLSQIGRSKKVSHVEAVFSQRA